MTARPCLLLVDDDADVRLELSEALGVLGVDVRTAAGPAEGMAILRATPGITVVITDLRMPTGDGLDFADGIHQTFPRGIEIIVLTGHGAPGHGELMRRHRLLAFVRKPIRLAQLVSLVREGHQRALAPGDAA